MSQYVIRSKSHHAGDWWYFRLEGDGYVPESSYSWYPHLDGGTRMPAEDAAAFVLQLQDMYPHPYSEGSYEIMEVA